MTYAEKEAIFINNLQTKLSLLMIDLTKKKRLRYSSDEFFKVREIRMTLDYLANTRYDFIDEDSNTVFMDKCKYDEDKLIRLFDFLKGRFCLTNLPYIEYPKRITNVLFDLLQVSGTTLPPGGGPGFYLTKNSTGTLIWKRINTFIFRQGFIYTSGPLEFELGIVPEHIIQVFVNGQLLNTNDYSLDGNTVTILAPNTLTSGAEIQVFAGYDTLTFADTGVGFSIIQDADGTEQFDSSVSNTLRFEGANGIEVSFDSLINKVTFSSDTLIENILFEDEFTAADTGTVFTLSDNARKIVFVFINGQKIKSTDYAHTTGSNSVTLSDSIEVGDEIDVVFNKSAS